MILGNGGTTWRMADASPPDRDGWQQMPVDPQVVAARVAGLSHGFLVFDDTGSEWTRDGEKFTFRLFPNRFVYSRDQNRASAPYFTVELGPDDRRPPAAPSGLQRRAADGAPAGRRGAGLVGHARATTARPARSASSSTLDGRALPRELIPLAGAPGARVEMHLRDLKLDARRDGQAVGAGRGRGRQSRAGGDGRHHGLEPASRRRCPSPGRPRAAVRQPPHRLPRVAGAEVAIIDELDKVHPVTGELIPSQPEGYLAANISGTPPSRTDRAPGGPERVRRLPGPAARRQLRRGVDHSPSWSSTGRPARRSRSSSAAITRRHQARPAPRPDRAARAFPPSAARRRLKSQSLHVEVYVPHDVPAGEYRGDLDLAQLGAAQEIAAPAGRAAGLGLHPARSPQLPARDELLRPAGERARLLPPGPPAPDRAEPAALQPERPDAGRLRPRWDGRRLDLDWSAWDRRFGPLLDGSAFADLPRKGVPVECFYLPLHENWPSPMEGNYNGDYWADRAFPESYRRAFVAAARQIAEHLRPRAGPRRCSRASSTTRTTSRQRGWSRGSSPWLLDEPANFQDYWALRYFARAFHEGINQADRCDAAPRASASLAHGWSSAPTSPGRNGGATASTACWTTTSSAARCGAIRGWSSTASGPWARSCWSTARPTRSRARTSSRSAGAWIPGRWGPTASSPGRRSATPSRGSGPTSWRSSIRAAAGEPRECGPRPIPSIRLKAYRRGQQDVEYLTLWSQLHNEPRWAVGQQVRAALKLAGTRQGTGFTGGEDAGRIDYGRLRPRDVWALRVAIGEALSQAHPAAQEQARRLPHPAPRPGPHCSRHMSVQTRISEEVPLAETS